MKKAAYPLERDNFPLARGDGRLWLLKTSCSAPFVAMMKATYPRERDNLPLARGDRPPVGRILVERTVRPVRVVVGNVSSKSTPQMLFAEHNQRVAEPQRYAKIGELVQTILRVRA